MSNGTKLGFTNVCWWFSVIFVTIAPSHLWWSITYANRRVTISIFAKNLFNNLAREEYWARDFWYNLNMYCLTYGLPMLCIVWFYILNQVIRKYSINCMTRYFHGLIHHIPYHFQEFLFEPLTSRMKLHNENRIRE